MSYTRVSRRTVWFRQVVLLAAKASILLVAGFWTACFLRSEALAGRFNEDVENHAKWSSLYTKEELSASLLRAAADRGVAVDDLNVSYRQDEVVIFVVYHMTYAVGPVDRTFVYRKQTSAPTVARN